jgi:hypothetical protein
MPPPDRVSPMGGGIVLRELTGLARLRKEPI